jgi:hypothetical protein
LKRKKEHLKVKKYQMKDNYFHLRVSDCRYMYKFRGAFVRFPPRTGLAKASPLLLLTVAFIVRGNVSHFLIQRRLTRRFC